MALPIIYGKVLDQDGRPLQGVTVLATGSGYSASFSDVSNVHGEYSIEVHDNWNGELSASRANYELAPIVVSFDDNLSDDFEQDFVATITHRFLRLVRTESEGVPGRTQGWRLKVEVTEADGVDKAIFLYHRQPFVVAVDDSEGDFFRKVCSPSDIEEFPLDEPDPQADLPFYRLASIDVIFRSPLDREETWEAILEDIRELGRTLTAMADLDAEMVTHVVF